MTAALFDTNIIIDALNGREAAAAELLAYCDAAISIITWIEVLTGMPAAVRPEVEQFLADAALTVVSLTGAISAETVRIRYAALHELPKRRLKLPDAIIQATANCTGRLLITRNTTDFSGGGIRVPYEINADGVVINVLPTPQGNS
ncbi:PIN domain-containing protein [Pseudoduganella aquatica]|uniref:PIN domain-containing protein n=1 Tax=Pseudoduganella aquatica TaxID=2660641 RepID=A0A7X4KQA2_9BURK|nr:PIN domain-containing protein [Pseudoduganella aquatica]MYN11143.1 PIN domain-containing protein [Pseudoduganella aquatica]